MSVGNSIRGFDIFVPSFVDGRARWWIGCVVTPFIDQFRWIIAQ
jgi:hypothetical protein